MSSWKDRASKVNVNQIVKTINLEGKTIETSRLTKLFIYKGTTKLPVDYAVAGDIVHSWIVSLQ